MQHSRLNFQFDDQPPLVDQETNTNMNNMNFESIQLQDLAELNTEENDKIIGNS